VNEAVAVNPKIIASKNESVGRKVLLTIKNNQFLSFATDSLTLSLAPVV
jgi:hypothetical protein